MKKVVILLIAALFILASCGQETSAPESKSKNQQEKTEKPKAKEASKQTKDSKKQQEKKPMFRYQINENNWAVEPIKDADRKVVLLTIDDAPDKHAVEMAEKLKALDVPAIFFVNGHFLESETGKVNLKKMHDMGFVIGNHTYSHSSLPDLPESKQKEEIVKVDQMVVDAIGERPSFFRAPFGQNTDYTKKLAASEGMTLMNWTYGYDWNKEYMSRDAIADIMVNAPELQNGANLLMHDRDWTNAALESIVKGLQDKGYGFVDPKEIKGYHAS